MGRETIRDQLYELAHSNTNCYTKLQRRHSVKRLKVDHGWFYIGELVI